MIDAIHQSMLTMASRCGEQFRRRYGLGQIIPPGVAAARGTGVHGANEANLKQKIISSIDLAVSDLKDAARDSYVKALSNGVYLSREEQPAKDKLLNDGLNDCLRLTELYREEVAPSIKPVAVEEPFLIDMGLSLPLAGRIDYQEEPKIGDLKTTTKSWAKDRIKKEVQPIFYSLAHERTRNVRPEFVYHILVALKTETKHQPQSITPTDDHYRALIARLRVFLQMIETGTFLPANPASWWCDEKWCGYWRTCKYVGN